MSEDSKNESLKLKLLGPAAEAAGETLRDAWEFVFGGFGTYVEKKRIERNMNVIAFKKELENRVNNIPGNQLREPPLAIVGPALEASKYYFEEEEIRNMFASVISASMDARVSSLVHPSFPTIIQQLSSTDAQTLACFSLEDGLPICEYQIKFVEKDADIYSVETAGYRVIRTNIFLANAQICDLDQGAISIESLARLGLISVDYERELADVDYKVFENTDEYRSIVSECKDNPKSRPYINKGSTVLTPLGQCLWTICFSEHSKNSD